MDRGVDRKAPVEPPDERQEGGYAVQRKYRREGKKIPPKVATEATGCLEAPRV